VFGGDRTKAVFPAIAVEILHNFTLVHDDIMDGADLRRSNPTVHTKWDMNTAILTGDIMFGITHQTLLKVDIPRLPEMLQAFTAGIIEVCEGQGLDLAFENRTDVVLGDYLQMIDKKTAKMLELSVAAGAYMTDASTEQVDALKCYARSLGVAFQIQDDVLDISSQDDEFGKKIGGDIEEGKKTFLTIKAVQQCTETPDKELLQEFLQNNGLPAEKVPAMQELLHRNGIIEEANAEVQRLTKEAIDALEILPDNSSREMLVWFAGMLLRRTK
jgi:geranylgeranyl diphosphate synthase type II